VPQKYNTSKRRPKTAASIMAGNVTNITNKKVRPDHPFAQKQQRVKEEVVTLSVLRNDDNKRNRCENEQESVTMTLVQQQNPIQPSKCSSSVLLSTSVTSNATTTCNSHNEMDEIMFWMDHVSKETATTLLYPIENEPKYQDESKMNTIQYDILPTTNNNTTWVHSLPQMIRNPQHKHHSCDASHFEQQAQAQTTIRSQSLRHQQQQQQQPLFFEPIVTTATTTQEYCHRNSDQFPRMTAPTTVIHPNHSFQYHPNDDNNNNKEEYINIQPLPPTTMTDLDLVLSTSSLNHTSCFKEYYDPSSILLVQDPFEYYDPTKNEWDLEDTKTITPTTPSCCRFENHVSSFSTSFFHDFQHYPPLPPNFNNHNDDDDDDDANPVFFRIV
jgi:hypothetical protein